MNKTYRLGIIGHTGCGNYGHGIEVACTKVPGVQVVALADADDAGRAAAAKKTGVAQTYASYREMLQREQLDIVAICPRWIDQHHDMLLAAANAGCHVYMEKPFCRTLVEADEIVQQFAMRHLHLGIAHISQYSPVLDTTLRLISEGIIGDVLELRGRGKEDRRGGGEDLWVLGSHIFGLMRSFGGGQPLTCTATVTSGGEPIRKTDVVDGAEGLGLIAGDHIQATYQFPGGVTGYFASKRNMGGNPSRFAIQVFGSKGVIELESGYLQPAHILPDSSWSPGRTGKTWEKITSAGLNEPEPRTDGTYEGGHIAAIVDLIHCIETQEPTRCNTTDCRDIVEMTAAVYESQRLGQRVELPLATRENPLGLL